jgi:hypothetical protein
MPDGLRRARTLHPASQYLFRPDSRFAERPSASRGLQFYNNIHMSAIPPLAEAALTLCVRHRTFSALSSKRDAVPYVNSG